MSAFIPGPWRVVEHSWERVSVYGPSYGEPICSLSISERADEDSADAYESEMRAAACLIAAAPELYDAADMALNTLIGCCVPAGGVDDRKTMLEAQAMLRVAIKKATGAPS